ncbi:MAG TPA: hypothetical protein VGE51_03965 [Fontimonas sp.]
MKYAPGIIAAMLAASSAAWAGGSATLETSSDDDVGQTTVEYDGKGSLRMDGMGDQQKGYLLIRDNKAYSVINEGGTPVVIDLASAMTMLGALAKNNSAQGATAGNEVARFISLDKTGASETVAGISGSVYKLTFIDDKGQQQTEELVLSKDSRARELTKALTAMGKQMARAADVPEPEGAAKMYAEIDGTRQGVLRYGSEFRVTAFSGEPSAKRFELPAQPQQMPNLADLMSGMGGTGATQADDDAGGENSTRSNPLGDLFGQKAQRQADRVEGKTDQKVDETTDRAVDKVLDKALGKLFGD